MTDAYRAQAAHDAIKQYSLAAIYENPPQPRRVPAWNLDAPTRAIIECHDDGAAMWLDDPASLNPMEG